MTALDLTDPQREASAELASLIAAPLAPTRRFLELPDGLHENLAPEVYHERIAGVASKSVLDMIAKAPAVYLAWLNGLEQEPTEAMEFGTAFHCAALEPERFKTAYSVEPVWTKDGRTKEGKLERAEWWANHPRLPTAKTLSAKDGAKISGMVQAVLTHPLAGPLIRDGQPEVSAKWRDPTTDLICKSRADFVHDLGCLVDLKTVTDASESGFRRTIYNFHYHHQAAFYRQGFTAVGAEIGEFLFVACEKEPPYLVAVYSLDMEATERGRRDVAINMRALADCIASGIYPGYPERIGIVGLPPWA
jgi:hypothetical protein